MEKGRNTRLALVFLPNLRSRSSRFLRALQHNVLITEKASLFVLK